MKDKLAQYKQYKEELSAELRKYVQDKNNPLNERFEALIECSELSESVCTFEHKYLTKYFIYDNDADDRGSYHLTTDVLYNNVMTPEEEITFKEYCCDNFISSMIFDW